MTSKHKQINPHTKIFGVGVNTTLKPKVFVGLSGGVDSSVSAALLKRAGFLVTGVFIKVWHPDWISCTWKEDRLDAMRVCAKLKIPFITLDLEKEYKKEVIDYMLDEYKMARTPNPDVMCNKYIKFGSFLKWARSRGADYVATGHYARIAKDNEGLFKLLQSVDEEKDQTYFLWNLGQSELSKIIFPIGGLKKKEVRILARKFGLVTAEKKDSQGLCFMGKIDMRAFLGQFIPHREGNVLNEKGEIVGEHHGVTFYTIGQRHGFNINEKTASRKAYYVVSKNIKRNILTVTNEPLRHEFTKKIIDIEKTNWISGHPPTGKFLARPRYRAPLSRYYIERGLGSDFLMKVRSAGKLLNASGQSLVFYKNGACLGGGIIK